jgi:acetyl esterase/lipase
MRYSLTPVALTLALAAPLFAADTDPVTHLDIPYAEVEGVDPSLLSLDVSAPADADDLPVMVFIHGGTWRAGDKASFRRAPMPGYFAGEGFVFVNINYRLSPAVQHPVHVQDVAAALAWVHSNISEYGGDPDGIYVMGHSAGAHLANLVAVSPRYLEAEGKDLSILKGAVVLDTAAYDLPQTMKGMMGRPASPYRLAFGDDSKVWEDASPYHQAQEHEDLPPHSLVYAWGPSAGKGGTVERMAGMLRSKGVRTEVVNAFQYKSHRSLARELGAPGDQPTTAVRGFLASLEEARRTGADPHAELGTRHVCRVEGEELEAARQEIADYQTPIAMRWLDRDQDGSITEGEAALLRALFDRIDTNGDGRLVPDEVHEWYLTGTVTPAEGADSP